MLFADFHHVRQVPLHSLMLGRRLPVHEAERAKFLDARYDPRSESLFVRRGVRRLELLYVATNLRWRLLLRRSARLVRCCGRVEGEWGLDSRVLRLVNITFLVHVCNYIMWAGRGSTEVIRVLY